MKIWIRTGFFKKWIKNIDTFDLTYAPGLPRFTCKHLDGSASVTPVANLENLEWGVIPCRSATKTEPTSSDESLTQQQNAPAKTRRSPKKASAEE